MRILIVGGTSSLARVLIPILSTFAEVISAGRSDCDMHLDLSEPLEQFQRPQGIDVLINTAASFGSANPGHFYETEYINAIGTLKLCQLCTDANIGHMVQISSIFTCLDINSPFFSGYALSKRHADELAQLYCSQTELALTIIRPSQLYGIGPAYRKHQPFFFSIIDKVANGEDIDIYGTHDARRNFIHVEDVANVIALAIKNKIIGSFACMQLDAVGYSEIVAAAAAAFNSKSQIRFLSQHSDIADNIIPFDGTLYNLLDYYPRISIALGMEKEADYRRRMQ